MAAKSSMLMTPYAVTREPPEGFTAKPGIVGSHLVSVHQTRRAESGPWAECLRVTASWAEAACNVVFVECFVRKRVRWHRVYSYREHEPHAREVLRVDVKARTLEAIARCAAEAWEEDQAWSAAAFAVAEKQAGVRPIALARTGAASGIALYP